MNQKLSFQNVFVATVLFSFCSCASPSKDRQVAAVKPSAGAQIGKGAVTGLRYLVGAPFFLGMAILGPLGGASPAYGFEGLQQMYDYEPTDGPSKPKKDAFGLPPR